MALLLFVGALTATEERLLLRLLYLADREGKVSNLKQVVLAKNLGVSERSVRTALKELRYMNLVKLIRPSFPQRAQGADYEIDLKNLRATCQQFLRHWDVPSPVRDAAETAAMLAHRAGRLDDLRPDTPLDLRPGDRKMVQSRILRQLWERISRREEERARWGP